MTFGRTMLPWQSIAAGGLDIQKDVCDRCPTAMHGMGWEKAGHQ